MILPVFSPPGPGLWELEATHFPKPMPTFGLDRLIRGFKLGFAEGAEKYGLLISHFEIEIVNGFWYQQLVPFGATKGRTHPPPKTILWLVTRLHPAMRRRIRSSREAFSEKRWREDLAAWDNVDKPAAIAKHGRLLRVDPRSLDEPALLDHLHACEAHIEDMTYLHQKYTVASFAPIGEFLVHTSEWTGKEPGELLDIMRGSSKVSLGISTQELETLTTAIVNDEHAQKTLMSSGDAQHTLDSLRSADGPVGKPARAFVDLLQHRALSYNLGERAAGEMPEMLVRAIRSAVAGRFEPSNTPSSM